jgi:hypothetical protein
MFQLLSSCSWYHLLGECKVTIVLRICLKPVQICSLSSVYIVLCSLVCFSEFICDVVYSGFMRWIFFSAMDSSIFVSNNNTLYSLRLYNLNSSFVEPSLYTRLVDGFICMFFIVVCPFVLFLLSIVLSILLRYTDSDCPFGVFKLFSFHMS